MQGLAARVADLGPVTTGSLRIETGQLNPGAKQTVLLDAALAQMCRNHSYLYYFRLVGHPDLAEIERTFLNTRDKGNDERAYPRLNPRNEFLYVGSSFNIFQRFREHLGYGSIRTYSLHLAYWASDLDLKLDLVYAKYPFTYANYREDREVRELIQVIEDTLWDDMRPMFGRRGQR